MASCSTWSRAPDSTHSGRAASSIPSMSTWLLCYIPSRANITIIYCYGYLCCPRKTLIYFIDLVSFVQISLFLWLCMSVLKFTHLQIKHPAVGVPIGSHKVT